MTFSKITDILIPIKQRGKTKMSFSDNLQRIRKQRGLSQNKLAKMAGVSQTSIYQWERGTRRPKGEQYFKLANALGVSVHVLANDIPNLRDIFPNYNKQECITLGARTQQLREQRGFTREELSTICDLSISDIEDFENEIRVPTMPEVEKLAKGFDMPLNEFVSNTDTQCVFHVKNASQLFSTLPLPTPQSATERILLKMIQELNDDGKCEAFYFIDQLRQLDKYTDKDIDFKPYEDMLQSQHSSQESDATTEKTATTSTSETVTDNSEIITDNQ